MKKELIKILFQIGITVTSFAGIFILACIKSGIYVIG